MACGSLRSVPGWPWLGRQRGWAVQLSSSQTHSGHRFKRRAWEGIRVSGCRQSLSQHGRQTAGGRCHGHCAAHALCCGLVTGRTQDSSDFLASLSLGKGSLALWQPVNECSWCLLILWQPCNVGIIAVSCCRGDTEIQRRRVT